MSYTLILPKVLLASQKAAELLILAIVPWGKPVRTNITELLILRPVSVTLHPVLALQPLLE